MTYSPNILAFDLRLSELVPALEPLTARQLECLRWAAAGKSSADIGAIVGLSPRTVDDHLAAACRRLGVRTRVQAVVLALQHQLIPPSRG
jgi:LuxR family transcriptional regulator of spore coat protein